jgi:hypothetical protein
MEDARVQPTTVKPSYVLLMYISMAIRKLSTWGWFVRGMALEPHSWVTAESSWKLLTVSLPPCPPPL